jgi:hypothetical protein
VGEWRYGSTHFLTWALRGDEWSASRSGRFIPGVEPSDTYLVGDWVDRRVGLDAVTKRKKPIIATGGN